MPRLKSRVQIPFPAPSTGGIPKWLRGRSAKPLFSGSNPDAASRREKKPDLVGLFYCEKIEKPRSSPRYKWYFLFELNVEIMFLEMHESKKTDLNEFLTGQAKKNKNDAEYNIADDRR